MATNNPLFPGADNDSAPSDGSAQSGATGGTDEQPAVELIRAKLARLYGEEPDAARELAEAGAAPPRELSKHQKFMLELQDSGKSLADIQSAWHEYYSGLPDEEKRAVWREFYDQQAGAISHPFLGSQPRSTQPAGFDPKTAQGSENTGAFVLPAATGQSDNGAVVSEHLAPEPKPKPLARAKRRPSDIRGRLAGKKPAQLRRQIRVKTDARREFERRNLHAKHNLQSLAFGLSTGLIVLLIFMFSFFNEAFIAPFIHPGSASATPIILDPNDASPTQQPEIIIPKINVQIPLVFSATSTNENDIENALENGVVHYPTTVLPGQQGNTAYFGHSSNNIFSPGNYKFAFVLLHELVPGDIFYITYNHKVYVYQVYDKQIVSPSDVGVLNNVPDKTATATLITCDPPGTSLNRLVVWGVQISPSPTANSAPTAQTLPNKPAAIAGNGPSLWDRIWPF